MGMISFKPQCGYLQPLLLTLLCLFAPSGLAAPAMFMFLLLTLMILAERL
jgi:hypothetical protein